MLDFLKNFFGNKEPTFKALKTFTRKDQYFYRIATWDWLKEKQILIYDPYFAKFIEPDAWLQLVFLHAKGNLTVTDYINQMASLYQSKIPAKLDETIIDQLNSLYDLGFIAYSETPIPLEPKYEKPLSAQKPNEQ